MDCAVSGAIRVEMRLVVVRQAVAGRQNVTDGPSDGEGGMVASVLGHVCASQIGLWLLSDLVGWATRQQRLGRRGCKESVVLFIRKLYACVEFLTCWHGIGQPAKIEEN